MSEKFTKGPWRLGRPGTVVADFPVHGMEGADHLEYYGGHLVGESMTKGNACLAALAPEMFEICKGLTQAPGEAPGVLQDRALLILVKYRLSCGEIDNK